MFFVLKLKAEKKPNKPKPIRHIISSFLLTTQQELIGKLITANAWESPKPKPPFKSYYYYFISLPLFLMVGRYFTISSF